MALSPTKPESIKLQIPVSTDLAAELARRAKMLNFTQARLTKILLDEAVRDSGRIGEWLAARTCKKSQRRTSWLLKGDPSAVRLQVPVPLEVSEKIDQLASQLNQTNVRLAALLLDCALVDSRWVHTVLSTELGKAFAAMFGKPVELYESAELDEGESDRNHREEGRRGPGEPGAAGSPGLSEASERWL